MTWDTFDYCLLASAVALVVLALRGAEKWGPFKAALSTIFLTWVMVHTVWICWHHGLKLSLTAYLVFVYVTVKLWIDLFTRFPPGGRRTP